MSLKTCFEIQIPVTLQRSYVVFAGIYFSPLNYDRFPNPLPHAGEGTKMSPPKANQFPQFQNTF